MSVERVLFQFGAGVATVIPRLLARVFIKMGNSTRRPAKTPKALLTEQERMAACRDVVMHFAVAYGHIARECMSREELEAKIDSGIAPQDLSAELHSRIAAMPGVVLGVNTINSSVEIKLPAPLRDRHCYIIGKSGSGKTNLIRNMVFQDLAQGGGIGIIAPEQELLTEEIMPYIPEQRIDDVVYFNPSDTQSPIPFNPLFLADGEDIDLKVDDNLTIFKRLMGETQARMDEILRQSLYALMAREDSTLVDVEKLLSRSDDSFRQEIIRTSEDEQTRYFFESTYPSFPKTRIFPSPPVLTG